MKTLTTEDSKVVSVVWTNTDTTQGRGRQYPYCICLLKSTAVRMSHKMGVMGSDASVLQAEAYRINGIWYGPIDFQYPSDADESENKRIVAQDKAVKKAKELGLSDKEISALRGGR